MQETQCEVFNEKGEKEMRRQQEIFEAESRKALVNQMDDRLSELEPEGHQLNRRVFFRSKAAAKNKRKRERKARRNNR